jgi:hypothetical protein
MNKFTNIYATPVQETKNNFNAKTITVHMLIVEHSSKAVESSFTPSLCDQYSDETDGQLNTNAFIHK